MAKIAKNDQAIRNMLLRQGIVHGDVQLAPRQQDRSKSQMQAIAARRASFLTQTAASLKNIAQSAALRH